MEGEALEDAGGVGEGFEEGTEVLARAGEELEGGDEGEAGVDFG